MSEDFEEASADKKVKYEDDFECKFVRISLQSQPQLVCSRVQFKVGY